MKPSYYNYVIENKNGNGDALYYNMRTGSLAHMEAKHHKEFVQFIETGIEISDDKLLHLLPLLDHLILLLKLPPCSIFHKVINFHTSKLFLYDFLLYVSF